MKKRLVVLSGAGMSAESGISTFRDSGGLWEQHRIEDVATPEGWYRNPQLVLDFYNARRRELLSASPNGGHIGLARLEKDFDVRIITQNVDNLHERAGSTHVLHLHGELMKARSSKNPNLITELTPPDCDIHLGDLAADGSQLRPFIVWFNEAVPMIEPAIELVSQADIFVIVGTSLNVYPAAGLLNYVPNRVSVYLIDPKEVRVPADREITVIRQGATEGVKTLTKMLQGKEVG
ncbi:MAG TPA: NAD-dependent deacylase [Candidatus Gallibacteroides avistercoris]|uniref:NAD-dependent protein deacylase n=1 Tax=Candidatus Gallibacteroides avistercoris TaxID=2840833 RepID=A0A9D1M6X1_9BACT|nr:NAD-dependent deacylase [Candidatus Gallibacteroides avistercoris]